MAKYWLYLNDEVRGPFSVEQLIKVHGFSRDTPVCADDHSGQPGEWISSTRIPELARIFKAVEDYKGQTPPKPRPAPTRPPPVRRPPRPAPIVVAPAKSYWGWVVGVLFITGLGTAGYFGWTAYMKNQLGNERLAARSLVENARVTTEAGSMALVRALENLRVRPSWEFERTPNGLINVQMKAPGLMPHGVNVFAFEVNLQALTVRGLNTAAIQLLSEGTAPAEKTDTNATPNPPKTEPVKKKNFDETLSSYLQSIGEGNFRAVWDQFSERKKEDMAHAGISEDGFLRVQSLTYKVDAPPEMKIERVKDQSASEKVVLLRQTQAGKADTLVKQTWVKENKDWHLDNEQKKLQEATPPPAAPGAGATGGPDSDATSNKGDGTSLNREKVLSLPGLSTTR